MLIAASYIQLKHKDQVKFTSELPTLNPRILLSGPAGIWFGHIYPNSYCQILGSDLCSSYSYNVVNFIFQGLIFIRRCWQRH